MAFSEYRSLLLLSAACFGVLYFLCGNLRVFTKWWVGGSSWLFSKCLFGEFSAVVARVFRGVFVLMSNFSVGCRCFIYCARHVQGGKEGRGAWRGR